MIQTHDVPKLLMRCRIAPLLLPMLMGVGACSRIPDDGITFLDEVTTQTASIDSFAELSFTDIDGNATKLTDTMSGPFMVLVITRGWSSNQICWYCVSQTSKWARRHGELASRDAELVVIFPTQSDDDRGRVDELFKKIKGGDVPNESIPFPVLLDLNLQSVDRLGIRAELAKPATYIIDRQGRVRFAYVGQTMADRPSVDAVLAELDRLAE